MATIRAYTTIEQSRKLAEFLPEETADILKVVIMNIVISTIIEICLIIIACSLVSIANTLWDILKELKNK